MTLADRVRLLVDRYWYGSVNAAASSLGVRQQTLQRIVSGATTNPRIRVLEAIARGVRVSVDWLVTGEGRGPQAFDERGRRLTGGSARWLRLVETLYPERGGVREVLDDVPFGLAGFVRVLIPLKVGDNPMRKSRIGTLSRVQDTCADAWAELLEEAVTVLGANAVRARLDAMELAVAGGFTPFARFLAEGEMSKAEAKRYLEAWEDALTQGDGSPE